MTQSEPLEARPEATTADGEMLAARLLAARRVISSLNVESDVRMRLHLRLMAICTALKAPGAVQVRGARRLDRLMADAERVLGGNASRPE